MGRNVLARARWIVAVAALYWIGVAGSAAASEQVGVRAAKHQGYVRLVLDWARAVEYAVGRDGGDVIVTFERPFSAELASVAGALEPLVAKLTLEREGTTVRLHGKQALEAKVFTVGTRVVIDIARGEERSATEEPPAAAPEPEAVAEAPPAPAPAPATSAPVAPVPLHKPAVGEAVARLAAALSQDVEFPQAETVSASTQQVAAAAPTVLLPGAAPEPFWPMLARFVAREGATELRFVVNRPVAAAAFVRGDRFWIAFDGRFDVAVLAPAAAAETLCSDLGAAGSDEGTMLSCAVPIGTSAAVTRDGDIWQVRLSGDDSPRKSGIRVEADMPGKVTLRMDGAVKPLSVPTAEGPILVVPSLAAAPGLVKERWFSRYVLLPSSQGIALRTLGDGVEIATSDQAVTLTLDPDRAVVDAGHYLDPATWPEGDVNPGERLRDLVATADGGERAEKRLVLMRDLLAAGNAIDAIGHWRILQRQAPDVASRPEARALAGAIYVKLGRLADAAEYLDDPALGGGEAALWRAALDAERGRYDEAAEGLRTASESWHRMPDALRSWFGLTLASGLVEAGDPAVADSVLRVGLQGVTETPTLRERAAEIVGRIRYANGDMEGAMAAWALAAEGRDRLASALAREDRIVALIEEGELAPPEAAEELAKQAFAWRDDEHELGRLARLADLYLAAKDYRKALVTMRSMAVNFAEAPDRAETTRRMGQLFKDIMIGVSADAFTPLAALSVFYEFQELSPLGADGDAMVEGLAERLAAVDLLDKAGDLLQQQVAQRAASGARARVGARLAELRLAAGRPGDALQALAESGMSGLPEIVVGRRRLAEAQALAALDRSGEALALLDGDASDGAVALRADIHWSTGAWSEAAADLTVQAAAMDGATHAPVPDPPAPDALAEVIKRLAVAQAMASDVAGLAATRDRYAALFAERADRDVFALLTGQPQAERPANWDAVPAAVAPTADLEAFLSAYRSTLAPPEPSAVN